MEGMIMASPDNRTSNACCAGNAAAAWAAMQPVVLMGDRMV